jgi:hypothetical protein
VLILLKILAAWLAVSIATGFAIAPALSRRLRDINFPTEDEETMAARSRRPPEHRPRLRRSARRKQNAKRINPKSRIKPVSF